MDDDKKLSVLLTEWRLPGAPASLDARVLGARTPWWKRLLIGSIRIPVPVAMALAGALIVMAAALVHRPAPRPTSAPVDLAGFQPVARMNYRIIRGSE